MRPAASIPFQSYVVEERDKLGGEEQSGEFGVENQLQPADEGRQREQTYGSRERDFEGFGDLVHDWEQR